jgi:hypothetical protein
MSFRNIQWEVKGWDGATLNNYDSWTPENAFITEWAYGVSETELPYPRGEGVIVGPGGTIDRTILKKELREMGSWSFASKGCERTMREFGFEESDWKRVVDLYGAFREVLPAGYTQVKMISVEKDFGKIVIHYLDDQNSLWLKSEEQRGGCGLVFNFDKTRGAMSCQAVHVCREYLSDREVAQKVLSSFRGFGAKERNIELKIS